MPELTDLLANPSPAVAEVLSRMTTHVAECGPCSKGTPCPAGLVLAVALAAAAHNADGAAAEPT